MTVTTPSTPRFSDDLYPRALTTPDGTLSAGDPVSVRLPSGGYMKGEVEFGAYVTNPATGCSWVEVVQTKRYRQHVNRRIRNFAPEQVTVKTNAVKAPPRNGREKG